MKFHLWKIAALLGLPLMLGVFIARQNSWRPRILVINAPAPTSNHVTARTMGGRIWTANSNATLAFSPDGQTLQVGLRPSNSLRSEPYQIQLWNVAAKTLEHKLLDQTMPKDFEYSRVVLSNDRTQVAVASPTGELNLSKVGADSTGMVLKAPTKRRFTSALAFSPNGDILAQARTNSNTGAKLVPSQILLWNTRTNRLIRTLSSDNSSSDELLFSPDGQTIINNTNRKMMRVWDVKTGSVLYQRETFYQIPVISPNDKTVAVMNQNGYIDLLETRTGKVQKTLKVRDRIRVNGQPDRSLDLFMFSPDGQTLAVLSTLYPSMYGNVKWINPMVFSQNSVVTLWDVSSGALLGTIEEGAEAIKMMAFAPDGLTLLTTGQNAWTWWNVATKRPKRHLKAGTASVSSIAFAPDGSTLAVADRQGKVILLRLK